MALNVVHFKCGGLGVAYHSQFFDVTTTCAGDIVCQLIYVLKSGRELCPPAHIERGLGREKIVMQETKRLAVGERRELAGDGEAR